MDLSIDRYLLLCGVLAPVWMLIGVAAAGRLYPGYSHRHQAMSELGARERPTTAIHPFINNYPIGILFTAFGVGVALVFRSQPVLLACAVLLMLHGVAHIVAGIFPCDADLGANGPSLAQKLHGVAGLVMYFALLAACLVWVLVEPEPWRGFRAYSLLSAAASLVSLGCMARALQRGRNFGLHQRVSYGILAVWCAVLGLSL